MEHSFSGCEIVEIGIQIEKNAIAFFGKLAETMDNPRVKEIFKALSEEDEQHLDDFKKIFGEYCSYEKGLYTEEYFGYMQSLASSYVFTKENVGEEIAEKITNEKDAIELGVSYVKEAVLFYEGMEKVVPEKDKEIVEGLIAGEKEHLNSLCALKDEIYGPDDSKKC